MLSWTPSQLFLHRFIRVEWVVAPSVFYRLPASFHVYARPFSSPVENGILYLRFREFMDSQVFCKHCPPRQSNQSGHVWCLCFLRPVRCVVCLYPVYVSRFQVQKHSVSGLGRPEGWVHFVLEAVFAKHLLPVVYEMVGAH